MNTLEYNEQSRVDQSFSNTLFLLSVFLGYKSIESMLYNNIGDIHYHETVDSIPDHINDRYIYPLDLDTGGATMIFVTAYEIREWLVLERLDLIFNKENDKAKELNAYIDALEYYNDKQGKS